MLSINTEYLDRIDVFNRARRNEIATFCRRHFWVLQNVMVRIRNLNYEEKTKCIPKPLWVSSNSFHERKWLYITVRQNFTLCFKFITCKLLGIRFPFSQTCYVKIWNTIDDQNFAWCGKYLTSSHQINIKNSAKLGSSEILLITFPHSNKKLWC